MPIIIQHGDIVPYLTGMYLMGQPVRAQLQAPAALPAPTALPPTALPPAALPPAQLPPWATQPVPPAPQSPYAYPGDPGWNRPLQGVQPPPIQQQVQVIPAQPQPAQAPAQPSVDELLDRWQKLQRMIPRTPRGPSVPDWYREGQIGLGQERLDVQRARLAEMQRHNMNMEDVARMKAELQRQAQEMKADPNYYYNKQFAVQQANLDVAMDKLQKQRDLGLIQTPEEEQAWRMQLEAFKQQSRFAQIFAQIEARKDMQALDKAAQYELQTRRFEQMQMRDQNKNQLRAMYTELAQAQRDLDNNRRSLAQARNQLLADPNQIANLERAVADGERKVREQLQKIYWHVNQSTATLPQSPWPEALQTPRPPVLVQPPAPPPATQPAPAPAPAPAPRPPAMPTVPTTAPVPPPATSQTPYSLADNVAAETGIDLNDPSTWPERIQTDTGEWWRYEPETWSYVLED